jgi:lipopolysaccharide/colanic/teichoic acid biosynthesis glycosyltransferase
VNAHAKIEATAGSLVTGLNPGVGPGVSLPSIRERGERVLVVGTGARAARVVHVLMQQRHVVIGAIDDSPQGEVEALSPPVACLGGMDRLLELVLSEGIDRVYVALPLRSGFDALCHAREVSRRLGVPVTMAFDLFGDGARVDVGTGEDGTSLHYNQHRSRRWFSRLTKRAVDVAVAGVLLVLLAPLLLAVAAAIAVSMGQPILFRQERVGLHRRRFGMIKFRTMVPTDDSHRPEIAGMDPSGVIFKAASDPRVTTLGRWLRKSSIDELPQLFNVLRGDMSLVGPRPLPVWVYAAVDNVDFHRRFSVMPGLTGRWQVNGRVQQFSVMMDHDLDYVDRWSVREDLRILVRTPWAVLRGTGAS